ncbi:MAG: hypothetical protein ACK50J_28535 [Planctomyces sp.]
MSRDIDSWHKDADDCNQRLPRDISAIPVLEFLFCCDILECFPVFMVFVGQAPGSSFLKETVYENEDAIRVYSNRTAGGDRHHRSSGFTFAASGAAGT